LLVVPAFSHPCGLLHPLPLVFVDVLLGRAEALFRKAFQFTPLGAGFNKSHLFFVGHQVKFLGRLIKLGVILLGLVFNSLNAGVLCWLVQHDEETCDGKPWVVVEVVDLPSVDP